VAFNDTGRSALTVYRYRVLAFNAGGNSTYSAIAETTTLAPPAPTAPSGLTATPSSHTQVDLSWSDNSSSEDGVRIERCTGTGCTSFSEIFATGSNVVAYSDTGRAALTVYRYRVLAFNAGGSSAYSNIADATTPAAPLQPPAAPSNLSATPTSYSQVELSWSDNSSNENGFQIERCTGTVASCGSFAQIGQVSFDINAVTDAGLHGQTTYIQQGYPAFHSPYLGENSFTPWAQTRQTWTASAFLGLRLWEGGELYYNPELLQGFGLHNTSGAAGFPNGEAQKSNFPYPRYNTSRLFVRQTLGFGGEQETVESAYGQMAQKRDVSRLTVQVGKFAVHDVFDNNAYAMDSRADFMNWSIWAAGAFDYPADKVGLTYGAVVELNQKHWALRIGYFLTGNQPNANELDMHLFTRGAYVTELETRYTVFSRPGKFRVAVWADTYFSGSYREAIDLTLISAGLDPNDAILLTRQARTKYGYYLNFEQALTDDVGIFGRWSWNNGKTEIAAFTDIDASLSFGTSIRGTSWGRPDDKIGLAGAINALSRDHRDFLAIGGLGILIGDGQINYRPEKILETFYAYNVNKWSTLTFDYQFIADLAHNADRGPVSVFSARLHAEF